MFKLLNLFMNFVTCYAFDGDGGGGAAGGEGGEGGEGGAEGGEGGHQSAGGQPSNQPFYNTFENQELKTWAENKGWSNPEAMAQSARNLEKMAGAPAEELVRLPQNADDATVRQVLSKLGMPDSADKYEFAVPEGAPQDETFTSWAKETFHKAGLTTQQAKVVNEAWNELATTESEKYTNSLQEDYTAGTQALKTEWGDGFDRNMRAAQTAAQNLGFDEETLNAVQSAKGYAETIKMMAALGEKMGEDSFVSGEMKTQGFHSQMTPEEAKSSWAALQRDDGFMKQLMNKSDPAHKDALARKERLFSIMHPEG